MLRRIVPVLALAAIMTTALACSSSGASSSASGGTQLTGTTWQWTASTTKVPAGQGVVPDPENYTILFNTDGTYSGKADCNQMNGSYTVSGSNLTITPGAMTLAACPEGSMDTLYLAGLAATKSYAISGTELTLTLADEGTMTFNAG